MKNISEDRLRHAFTAGLSRMKVIASVYGVMLVIAGLYKARTWHELKSMHFPVSVVTLIGAILSVILGVIIVLHPSALLNYLWIFTGLSMIASAVVDAIAVVLNLRR